MWRTKDKIFYILYAISAKWLPESRHLKLAKRLRAFWARRIIHSMGSNVNVERGAFFTPDVCIGNDSGIGTNCELNGPVTIGSNVLNVYSIRAIINMISTQVCRLENRASQNCSQLSLEITFGLADAPCLCPEAVLAIIVWSQQEQL